jgi:hypothetical protein
MIDDLTNSRINALAAALDDLLVKHAALVAILGAVIEKYHVEESRVDEWCRAIAALRIKNVALVRLRFNGWRMIS